MSEFDEGLEGALKYAAAQALEGAASQDHPQGGQFVILPAGHAVHVMEPLAKPLHHVKQAVRITNQQSFIAYFNRFKNGESTIFGDVKASPSPRVAGIIDYHSAPIPETDSDVVPEYLDHRLVFDIPWSEQWARWRAIDNKPMGQVDFAEFIEENFMDVVEPPNALMLEMVTNLEAKKSVAFSSGVRLQNGDTQLSYIEATESKGKGNFVIPTEFKIGLPVFFGGTVFEVRVLLRHRIDEGKLKFTAKINRREFVEQIAFEAVLKAIAEGTGVTPLSGMVAGN